MQKVIITGASGMLGSTLTVLLVKEGTQVFAVVRPGSKKLANLPASSLVTVVECSLADIATLDDKIKCSCDAFFHFAWENTFGAAARNDMDSQLRNVRHTLDAVRVAKKLSCNVFVGAGSQAEYGRVEGVLTPNTPTFPENGYGMAKLCAGQMSRVEAQSLGVRHVWARILSVYGPGDGAGTVVSSVLRALLQGETPACTKGEQLWDFLYSEDAAAALLAMAKSGRDGAVYPLGSGQAKPLRYYLETMRDRVNPALSLSLGAVPYAPKQVMHLQADITALTHDTGVTPQTAFADGIDKTLAWMKEGQA